MKTAGLQFFSDRDTLDRTRTWAELMASCREMDALFLIGDNVTSQAIDLQKVKRMLLPRPDSDSVRYFSQNGGRPNTPELIRESTKTALGKGIKVRWTDEFVGYSLYILDKNAHDARVHIEYILPTMLPARRPSLTIWKRRFPNAFTAFLDAYDGLWEDAKSPP